MLSKLLHIYIVNEQAAYMSSRNAAPTTRHLLYHTRPSIATSKLFLKI